MGTSVGDTQFCQVSSLAVYNDQLVAAGSFRKIGDVACDGVAAWDGQRWHALSGNDGLPPDARGGSVSGLTLYNGRLFALGYFTSPDGDPNPSDINAWDGHHWQPVGHTNSNTYALLVYEGKLAAAGWFSVIDGMVSNGLAFLVPQYDCDINADGQVNVGDLQVLVAAWGTREGEAAFSTPCDITGDGYVNVGDLQMLIANWGR